VAPQNRIQAQLEAAVSCFASLNTLSISHCDSIRPETIDGVLKAVGKQITTFKMAVWGVICFLFLLVNSN
jgi:hypothetical protein